MPPTGLPRAGRAWSFLGRLSFPLSRVTNFPDAAPEALASSNYGFNRLLKKPPSLILSSVLVAATLDRIIVGRYAPVVSKVLLVRPGLIVLGVPVLEKATFGVIPLVVVPLLAVWVLLIPTTGIMSKHAWIDAFQSWLRIVLGVVLVPALMLVGRFLYGLVEDSLPKMLGKFLTSFGLKPTFLVWSEDTPLIGPLNGSFACLAGIVSEAGTQSG